MNSLTKNRQSKDTIAKMVEKYFTPLKMESYHELTEGCFNMAYEIRLSNGKQVILKIAPLTKIHVMTYEKNIMSAEVETMRLTMRNGQIPVPKVIGYDNSCTVCNSPYFFMEKLASKKSAFCKSQPPVRADQSYLL